MARIFISYRREDCQYQADKLHGALKPYVADPRADIFIDVDNIPLGVDFADYLDSKVGQTDVLLALIGHGWLSARDTKTGGRRLDDPQDFVRLEIASALRRGIPVVPVLFDGAPVPEAAELPEDLKPLARRNGIPVNRASFEADVARLVRGLPVDLKGRLAAKPEKPRRGVGVRLGLFGLIAAVFLGMVLVPRLFPADEAPPLDRGEVPQESPGSVPVVPPERAAADDTAMDTGALQAAADAAAMDCPPVELVVYFEWDRPSLTSDGLRAIEAAVEDARGCRTREVRIVAHTDTTHSGAYAVGLSQRMADSVASAFTGFGVPAERIVTEGRGASQLAVQTGPMVREPMNRRARIEWTFEP
ncbi:OmpA family protein [Hyphomonas sp.]|uniref:OmpA family protein n=1 Tax=Hyphomonas sp. TaxID=87 RepID=UPI00391B74A5